MQVAIRAAGLLVVGLASAYFAGRLGLANQSSRLGRFSRKFVSLSPLIAGLLALVVWFAFLGNLVGASTFDFEIYLALVILVISASLMARDRITTRMAVRNFTRRKTSMAIVILGLMIGTAMISGSLVTGDTLTELFTRGAYYGYGYADEVVHLGNPSTGFQYFNLNLSRSLATGLKNDPVANPYLVGVTPEILDTTSLNDVNTGDVQAGMTLIGTFPNASLALGDFHSSNNLIISPNINDFQTILNDRAARDLNATVGDTVVIHSSQAQSFKVVGIAISDARAYFSQGDDVFVSLTAAGQLTGHPLSANYIAITNIGGLRGSIQYSQTVGLAANQTLNTILQPPPGLGCNTTSSTGQGGATVECAYAEKKAGVDSATTSAQSLSNFFIVLSSFAILAGVVLIVNIFVMLAEERKSEMGMSRAVGMKRGQLTRMFLFEGSLYAAGAAFVGVFAGIGIAYAILYTFGEIITSFFPVSLAVVLNSFTFTPTTLVTAFVEGLLITYFTILLTSWRVSKLNIIRAIRSIAEPPQGVRTYTVLLGLGVVSIILGVFAYSASFSAKSALEALVGPSLVIFGTGLILSRFLRNRYAFTITGLALLLQWGIPNFSWDNPIIQNYSFGPELFFVGGIMMVIGGILVVMYNTDVMLKGLHVFYSGRKTLTPIFKTALSYPENKRFRTAATVAMFALVLFTVSAIASLAAEQSAALDTVVKQDSGGYDIFTTTSPVSNISERILSDSSLAGKIASVIPFNSTGLLRVHGVTSGSNYNFALLVGADPDAPSASNFFLTNTFNMVNMTSNYKTTADVWNAVRQDPSKVVVSFAFVNTRGPPTSTQTPNPGEVLEITGLTSSLGFVSRNVTVVGVLNGVFLPGIIGTSQLLKNTFGIGTGSFSFVKVAAGVDTVGVANVLRRDFIGLKMSTLNIPVLVSDFAQIGQSFLGLFEGFLGLGLVVGIAGLGILSIRSVVERRKEIGVMRALGFKRRMVVASFLLETSYIALLGIVLGVALGVNLGYAIAVSPGSGLHFVFPWQSILEIVALSYGLALLTTFTSARRAGQIPPAEALRHSE